MALKIEQDIGKMNEWPRKMRKGAGNVHANELFD